MPPTARRALTALAIVVLARVWCPNVAALPATHAQVPFALGLGTDEIAMERPPLVTASDSSRQQDGDYPTSTASNGSADMGALLDKYAPVFKLAWVVHHHRHPILSVGLTALHSSSEIFYPSSVAYMIKHYTFVRAQGALSASMP